MNPPFWFMFVLGVLGLLLVPKNERTPRWFLLRMALLCFSLICAAIVLFGPK